MGQRKSRQLLLLKATALAEAGNGFLCAFRGFLEVFFHLACVLLETTIAGSRGLMPSGSCCSARRDLTSEWEFFDAVNSHVFLGTRESWGLAALPPLPCERMLRQG